jgi:hypothetical protein
MKIENTNSARSLSWGIFAISAVIGAFCLILSISANAEEQVLDSRGRVVEIQQQQGNTTYAYDARHNYLYTATVAGNGGVYEYRDKYGVSKGLKGPGLFWNGEFQSRRNGD